MAYSVFISHAYDHQSIYFDLVQKLNSAGRTKLEWRNLSLQYDMRLGFAADDVDDEKLRKEIASRIDACDVMLVLTKPIASRRRWLQWEVAFAKDLGKPIIGIARKRNERVSQFVRVHVDDIVDTWRADHIANAIKQYARDYRARLRHRAQINALNPLPNTAQDEEVEPTPSPLSPEELLEAQEVRGNDVQPLTPRELLFRDVREVASGPVNPMPDQEGSFPRWWTAPA